MCICSLTRIFLSPVFVALFLVDHFSIRLVSLGVLLLCELCNGVDILWVRQGKTSLRNALEPWGDSIFRFSVFVALWATGYVGLWVIAILFYHDSIVSWIRIVAVSRNMPVQQGWSSKLRVVAQGMGAMIVVMLVTINCQMVVPNLEQTIWLAMVVIGTITAWAGVEELWRNWKTVFPKSL